ncbi:hypothetical protein BGZ93_009077 [Podila epicladia]|nr:hypothetical protein BGZ93_009077 [Podila epicladia]
MSQVAYQGGQRSPKDPHHLKRRHTRGTTVRSQRNSRSSSPSLSTLSDDFMCNSQQFDGHQRQHSNKSNTGHFHFEDPFYPFTAGASPPSSTNRSCASTTTPSIITSSHSTSLAPSSATTPSSIVPTWFGSLRSFAISASTSSRGAFAPLVTSSSSSSLNSPHTPSRGKSSSIYYGSSIMDPYDSDEDLQKDEPITDRNGLKENRVRGPRKSWSVFDPSVSSLFSQTYSAVPTTSEPDLSSPSTCSSSSSSLHSPTDSQIEELGVSDDAPCRVLDHGDCYKPASTNHTFYSSSSTSSPSFPTPTSSSASAFSLFKSYVPSIVTGFDTKTTKGSIALSDDYTPTSTPKTSTPTSMAFDAPNTGFWSLRKLTMNFMSVNQYEQVSNFEDEKEDLDEETAVSYCERYRDDLGDEDDQSKKTESTGSTYLSSMISTSSAMAAKGLQQLPVSNSVRDRLERLPGGGLQSVKKIGRQD